MHDFIITNNQALPSGCALLTMRPVQPASMPECQPGQFVQALAETPGVFLRRPISICDVTDDGHLVLFVKPVGKGSEYLCSLREGMVLNLLMPLGRGFTLADKGECVLLVGGGVGAAPLVYLSRKLSEVGADVTVAVGGRSACDVDGLAALYRANRFVVSTDDGTAGEAGLITKNTVFDETYHRVYCCGPTPMMRAVASIARRRDIWCEVSLENRMACGLGACLCCVEAVDGGNNVCVCTEGPVFNASRWR